MQIGSDEHKRLFCESFIAAHKDYDPQKLAWPVLSEADTARLHAIPFWRTAVAVESNAGMLVSAFARTIEDPLIRRAVAMQGEEEVRHAELLRTMLEHYGIPVDGKPLPSAKPTWRAFADFGYEECLDSYFGFGLFGVARRVRYFSDEFMEIFAPILEEETQHIVFFVNWIAYERARRGNTAFTPLLTAYGYMRALGRLAMTARSASHDGTGFLVPGSEKMIEGLSLEAFLASCEVMNRDFMSKIDPRLLQPRVIPAIGGFLLRLTSGKGRPAPAVVR